MLPGQCCTPFLDEGNASSAAFLIIVHLDWQAYICRGTCSHCQRPQIGRWDRYVARFRSGHGSRL